MIGFEDALLHYSAFLALNNMAVKESDYHDMVILSVGILAAVVFHQAIDDVFHHI